MLLSEELCSLHYSSIDNALQLICHLGSGAHLVRNGFEGCLLGGSYSPRRPQHLLAVTWDGAAYVDQSLQFRLRSAPKIFTAVADAMAWAFLSREVRFILHYLDDFLFIGPPG